MSSCVGPRPPHTITASLRSSAMRIASTMRAWLSPTFVWKNESIPARANRSPIHDEFVSTICPSSSSVPTATTSTDDTRFPPVLGAGVERQHHRYPQHNARDRRVVVADAGQDRQADGEILHGGLQLRRLPRRHRHALTRNDGAVHAHRHLAHG